MGIIEFYNICSIIFRHILGRMMIGKSLGKVSMKEDYKILIAAQNSSIHKVVVL